MKTVILTTALFLLGIAAFSQQEEKNGTIYIKHPYIDVVLKSMKAYVANDEATNRTIFSDTARYVVSGMEKWAKIEEGFKMWKKDFVFYDSIKVTQVGYPDYLHYVDEDAKTVQSWWKWSGKSRKTGKVLSVHFVQFDNFNKDGKIVEESLYGDFSKVETQ